MDHQYTGKEHVAAAFKREFTDRVPSRVWYKLGDFDKASGFDRKELRTRGDMLARYLKWLHEHMTSDTLTVPIGDAVMIAEAGGSDLKISMGEVIDRARRGLPLLEDKSLFSSFKLADLMQGQRLPYYCEACRAVASDVRDAFIEANAYAPWTLAGILRGNERLIYDTVDDPEFVSDLLRFTTGLTKQAALQTGKMGIDMFTLSDPAAGCSVISPDMFRRWSKPYLKEVVDFLKQNTDLKIGLHICGKIDKIMEDIADIGVDAISLDSASSLERMMEVGGGRVVIIGNVATELFLEGTADQIREEVRRCVDTLATKGGYILSSGCDVSGTKENIRHFLEYSHQYGRYGSK